MNLMVDGKMEMDYEDFVNKKPQLIKRISGDHVELMREHSLILQALSKHGHMTAKEIHHLYYIPQTQKHSKALKTIYRYLETLKNASLIQISGHRKPLQSRMTEKLCCRTALVLLPEENSKEKKWWESESGADFMTIFPAYLKQYLKLDTISPSKIESILKTYLDFTNSNTQDQFNAIELDPSLADLLTPLSVPHLKALLSITGVLKLMIDKPEFLATLKTFMVK